VYFSIFFFFCFSGCSYSIVYNKLFAEAHIEAPAAGVPNAAGGPNATVVLKTTAVLNATTVVNATAVLNAVAVTRASNFTQKVYSILYSLY